jgi:hypothetical protein
MSIVCCLPVELKNVMHGLFNNTVSSKAPPESVIKRKQFFNNLGKSLYLNAAYVYDIWRQRILEFCHIVYSPRRQRKNYFVFYFFK